MFSVIEDEFVFKKEDQCEKKLHVPFFEGYACLTSKSSGKAASSLADYASATFAGTQTRH